MDRELSLRHLERGLRKAHYFSIGHPEFGEDLLKLWRAVLAKMGRSTSPPYGEGPGESASDDSNTILEVPAKHLRCRALSKLKEQCDQDDGHTGPHAVSKNLSYLFRDDEVYVKPCPHYRSKIGEATGRRGCDPGGTYYEYTCNMCGQKIWDCDITNDPRPEPILTPLDRLEV